MTRVQNRVTSAEVEAPARRTVVRAGWMWWVLVLVGAGMNVFFVVAFGSFEASTADRIGTGIIGGAFAAAVLGIATSRIAIGGQILTVVAATWVREYTAADIADVDDDNGLSLILPTGDRVTPVITQPSLAQQLVKNRRRRREAQAIRAWLTGDSRHRAPASAESGARRRPRVRLSVMVGVPVWALASASVSLLLHVTVGMK